MSENAIAVICAAIAVLIVAPLVAPLARYLAMRRVRKLELEKSEFSKIPWPQTAPSQEQIDDCVLHSDWLQREMEKNFMPGAFSPVATLSPAERRRLKAEWNQQYLGVSETEPRIMHDVHGNVIANSQGTPFLFTEDPNRGA